MKVRLFGFLIGSLLLTQSQAQNISLDDVIKVSLEKNYDIRVLQETSNLAANDNKWAFGAFLPQVNATGSYVKTTNNSKNLTFATDTSPQTETVGNAAKATSVNGSLQLFWPIFDGSKMFATRKRIAELAILGQVNVRNQMMNTTALVITTYYNVTRQKQQLRALQELMAVNDERVKLAEKKLQVGTGGKPELLQAKVDLNAQRTAILQQQTLIQQLKDQLNGTLGMSLPDQYDVADSIPIDLSLTLDEIIKDIESTNQLLVAQRENIKVAKLVLWENRATRSPIISLTSAYNYGQTENQFRATPATQQYNRNQGYNYGVAVSIPIMNNLNVNRLIGAAKINIDRQQIIYDQQVAIAIVGVRNAYVNYDNAKKILLIEEENILLAKENVFIALEGFKRGIITALDLRTAQQSLADTYNQLIAARYSAKVSETELLRLKGALLNQ